MSACIRCGLVPLPGALYCEECIGARRAVLATGATGPLVPSNGATGARRSEEAQACTDGRIAKLEDAVAVMREAQREDHAFADNLLARLEALEVELRAIGKCKHGGPISECALCGRCKHGEPVDECAYCDEEVKT